MAVAVEAFVGTRPLAHRLENLTTADRLRRPGDGVVKFQGLGPNDLYRFSG